MCLSTIVSYFVLVQRLHSPHFIAFRMAMLQVCQSLYVAITTDTFFINLCKVLCTVDARCIPLSAVDAQCIPPISPWNFFLIVICSPLILFFMTSCSCKGFGFSPKKDQCTACACVIVAGPMGLSRHLARSPLCSKDYEAQLNPHC